MQQIDQTALGIETHELFTTAHDMLMLDFNNYWPEDGDVTIALKKLSNQMWRARITESPDVLDTHLVEIAIRALATVLCLRTQGSEVAA